MLQRSFPLALAGIVRTQLDVFVLYWNSHRVQYQDSKKMPSGATPQHIFTCPEAYGGERYSQPVPSEATTILRNNLEISREAALRWVSDEFAAAANEVYVEIGSPSLSLDSRWDVFAMMAPLLEHMYDEHE